MALLSEAAECVGADYKGLAVAVTAVVEDVP
jgi:hypothetical protein